MSFEHMSAKLFRKEGNLTEAKEAMDPRMLNMFVDIDSTPFYMGIKVGETLIYPNPRRE